MAAKAYNSEDEFEPRGRRSRRSRASAPTAALESEDTGSDDDDTPLQVRAHSRVRRSVSTVSSASSSSQITVGLTPPEPAAQERKLLATRFCTLHTCINVHICYKSCHPLSPGCSLYCAIRCERLSLAGMEHVLEHAGVGSKFRGPLRKIYNQLRQDAVAGQDVVLNRVEYYHAQSLDFGRKFASSFSLQSVCKSFRTRIVAPGYRDVDMVIVCILPCLPAQRPKHLCVCVCVCV